MYGVWKSWYGRVLSGIIGLCPIRWVLGALSPGVKRPRRKLEGGDIVPRIFNLDTRWRWVVSFTHRPLYPRYPLDMRLVGPQSRSGRSCEKKKKSNPCLCSSAGNRTPVAQPLAVSKGFIFSTGLRWTWLHLVWSHAFNGGPEDSVGQGEDVGSEVVRNVGILAQHYTASYPRRPRLEYSPPWKPQISQNYPEIFFWI
jgi:hypothetical protein